VSDMSKKARVLPMVMCRECGVKLVSKSVHDFQQCKCPNETFVDGGGGAYIRYGGKDIAKVHVFREGDQLAPHVRRRMPMWKILTENKHKVRSLGVIPCCHNCSLPLRVDNFRGAGDTVVLYGEKHWLSRWECPACGPFIIATAYPRV